MRLKLYEIELNATDVESSRKFYHDLLGLTVAIDQDGLKVFDSGWPGLDLNVSIYNSDKTVISFVVEDINGFVDGLRKKDMMQAIFMTRIWECKSLHLRTRTETELKFSLRLNNHHNFCTI